MFPLLPALWAQLGEIVYQALPFLCCHVGHRFLALQFHKLPRTRQQFVGDALTTILYLLLQLGDGLFTGLAALLQTLYLCLFLGNPFGILVESESQQMHPSPMMPPDARNKHNKYQ